MTSRRSADARRRRLAGVRDDVLTSKLAGFGTTIFAEMSALATATGAINLGQGFPDTDGPSAVLDAAIDAIRSGVNQYPPGLGRPGAPRGDRRPSGALVRHLTVDPDTEIVVTAGATEALAGAMLGMLDAGDEVVLFEPMYDSYQAGIALAAATPVPVLLQPRRRRHLAVRPRRVASSGHRADQVHPAQHAAQPDRQGVRPSRTGTDRRVGDRARPHRRHRRGVRTPRVRRRRARPARDAAGHVRADAHDLVGRQDVPHHRLEDRLDERSDRARHRGTTRQAVPHLRQRRPVPAGDGGRSRLARRVLRVAARATCRSPATDSPTGSNGLGSSRTGPRRATS